MAGSFFELGVAVEILNHKFRWPNRQVTTLSGDEAAAQTALSITADLTKYAQKGDSVLLGESTDAVDAGKSESAVVNSVSAGPNVLTVKTGISNTYDSGDPVVVYGSKFPNNWTFNANVVPQTILPSGGGKADRYAMHFKGTDALNCDVQFSFLDILRESIYYRVGCYYKFTRGFGGKSLVAFLNDGNSNIISADTVADATVSSWTRYAATAAQTNATLASVGNIVFRSDETIIGGVASDIYLDDVFVEHGEDSNNNGFYLFTEMPLQSGFDYGFITPGRDIVTLPNRLIKVNNYFGDKSERMFFRCRFHNVPASVWNAVINILRYGENGNLINFHPFIDDLPGVMTGMLQIENTTKSELWDRTYRSFDFIFTEA